MNGLPDWFYDMPTWLQVTTFCLSLPALFVGLPALLAVIVFGTGFLISDSASWAGNVWRHRRG